MKAKTFRKLINIADEVDIWFKKVFNLRPKQAMLETIQDRTKERILMRQ